MNPLDLFNQVKELVENKDFSAAKTFVEENKDQLGESLIKFIKSPHSDFRVCFRSCFSKKSKQKNRQHKPAVVCN